MVEVKPCPKCGGMMYHNKGISKKTGKPYENWKCGKCQTIEWVDRKPVNSTDGTEKILKYEDNEEQIKRGLALLNENMIAGFEVINNNIKALIQKYDGRTD